MRTLVLRITLAVAAVFQVALAAGFLFAPADFAGLLGLPPAAGWAPWIFAMFSARALALAYGSVLAFLRPERYRSWIIAMIGVQAIDWLATVAFITAGTITVQQASTAAFMPILFIAGLVIGFPRGRDARDGQASRGADGADGAHDVAHEASDADADATVAA
ncbi:hypothetical protein ACGGZK_03600 [Agromyces sp. MMS24-K17]|uniref:hypothetical protein n=1 Tax=Agromyces sp. MMS24-K17 TaxID=3372850 RepID=UPI00375489A6